MTETIQEETMREAAKFGLSALKTAIASYQTLEEHNQKTVHTDIPAFKKYHEACRSCIAHMKLLMALALMGARRNPVKPGDEPEISDREMMEIIEAARREVADYEARYPETADE